MKNLAPNVGLIIVFEKVYALLFYRWTSRKLAFQPKDYMLVQGHGKTLLFDTLTSIFRQRLSNSSYLRM